MATTRPSLRAWLHAKALRGTFDTRMCAYYGVDSNVSTACRKAICRAYVAGLVPTSTTGGRHAPGSFHGQRDAQGRGRAVDFGLRSNHVGTAKGLKLLVTFQRKEHWRARNHKINPVELIGPNNQLVILRDRETDMAEGSALETAHDDHVHEAY